MARSWCKSPSPHHIAVRQPERTGADGGSIFRRMLHRLQTAWEDGALWVSFVFGLGGLPPPVLVLFVVTPIVASGALIGTQILAIIVFVIAMFAVVELTLVSYLLAPAKTLAVLQPLHNWASAYRRRILIAIFGVVGSSSWQTVCSESTRLPFRARGLVPIDESAPADAGLGSY